MRALPAVPFLVTRMTPLAPLEPYTDRHFIFQNLYGLNLVRIQAADVSVLYAIDNHQRVVTVGQRVEPRIRIETAPAGSPLVFCTTTPDTRP